MKIFNNSEDTKTKAQIFYAVNMNTEGEGEEDWRLYSNPDLSEEATLDQVLSAYLDGNAQVMYYFDELCIDSICEIAFNDSENTCGINLWNITIVMDLDYDAIEKYYGHIIPDEFKGN